MNNWHGCGKLLYGNMLSTCWEPWGYNYLEVKSLGHYNLQVPFYPNVKTQALNPRGTAKIFTYSIV